MKYIIHKTDLFIGGKVIPEGTEIELTKEQTKGIEEFLIPIESERHTARSRSISEDSLKVEQETKSKGNKK